MPPPGFRSGSQKRQVPAHGALPRSFVSPRDRVRRSLGIWSEQSRRVPTFGTRIWPDVSDRAFHALALFRRSAATRRGRSPSSPNVRATSLWQGPGHRAVEKPVRTNRSMVRVGRAGPTDHDACIGMVRSGLGRSQRARRTVPVRYRRRKNSSLSDRRGNSQADLIFGFSTNGVAVIG